VGNTIKCPGQMPLDFCIGVLPESPEGTARSEEGLLAEFIVLYISCSLSFSSPRCFFGKGVLRRSPDQLSQGARVLSGFENEWRKFRCAKKSQDRVFELLCGMEYMNIRITTSKHYLPKYR
jgi:hypothetical protein